MSIDKDTVKYVARHAHLEMDDETVTRLEPELNNIIDWIELLGELDTENIEPLSNVCDVNLHLREDEVNDGNKQSDVLANAPEQTEGYFVVKKIVE